MNPLRVDDKPGGDTRWHVRAVLAFVGDALEAFEVNSAHRNDDSMRGASIVVKMCVDALKETEE